MSPLSLPHLNAALNCTATILLLAGIWQIRRGHERRHKACMLSAFIVSVAFLCSYVAYHRLAGHRPLGESAVGAIRTAYYTMLASHIILAALVPFLAVATIYLALKNRREVHRRLARWTFPIWLYVSVTGVVIYIMLYWAFPSPPSV